jgi:4-amino-4-deoxy-L-arabinose transferase-like glycosyltransferase
LSVRSLSPSPGVRPTSRQRAAAAHALAALPNTALYLLTFAAVALAHLTLLRLPAYWDEGGYYIPAAWDFYRTGAIIPAFTNAHPPLPNILLGSLWRLTGGPHMLTVRLAACASAALALVAVFRLAQRLLGAPAAIAVALLAAVYPIWFAQSSLAHADIFAAAFTLCALAIYIPARALTPQAATPRLTLLTAVLFSLAALSKETAIVLPAALAAMELVLLTRDRNTRRSTLNWLAALAFPILPLAAWYAYHRARTGFTFGNPEYLRYNATANLSAQHVLLALWYRLIHLVWQRNMWLPIVLAAACCFLPTRSGGYAQALPRTAWRILAVLLLAQWIAFSILGGALLTRYLLPAYPLLLIACVGLWQSRTARWPWLAAITAVVFVIGWWWNPPTAFAPEDNLTYRDMIVVQQGAIDYITTHFPDATVLTAWPVSTDMTRPELGYLQHPLKVTPVEDFSLASMLKAAQDPGSFDTAIVFTLHYAPPSLVRYWATHPNSRRGREFADSSDLSPQQVAALLGGQIVWQANRNGEWAAVLRFPRSYEANLTVPEYRP